MTRAEWIHQHALRYASGELGWGPMPYDQARLRAIGVAATHFPTEQLSDDEWYRDGAENGVHG
jgi:hypothetical protein